jgi:hypothetical protein
VQTLDADVDELLTRLIDRMLVVLGEKLVAVYLYGSLVTGDFDPAISDIDLLAVMAAELDDLEFERLDLMHTRFAEEHPDWLERIEVAYLSLAALRSFRSHASPIAVISPGEPFHMKEAGEDWLINWWVVRRQGVALLGPPPTDIIPPLSTAEFIDAVQVQAEQWQTHIYAMRGYQQQGYAILTMCRALYAYTNGEQVSKRAAAHWVERQLPEWAALVENALAWRAGELPETDAATLFPDTVKFVRFVGDRIGAHP